VEDLLRDARWDGRSLDRESRQRAERLSESDIETVSFILKDGAAERVAMALHLVQVLGPRARVLAADVADLGLRLSRRRPRPEDGDLPSRLNECCAAIETMGKAGRAALPGLRALLEEYRDPAEVRVRGNCLRAMLAVGADSEIAERSLLEMLKSEDPGDRYFAAELAKAAGRMQSPTLDHVRRRLLELLEDPYRPTPPAAAMALEVMGVDAEFAGPAILRAVDSAGPETTRTATAPYEGEDVANYELVVKGVTGNRGVLESGLRSRLENPDPIVRVRAALLLANFEPPHDAIRTALVHSLRDERVEFVRDALSRALDALE
jgi:hypothetical protein